ncbi:MAG: hypothetical protein ACLU99_14865 [Alphaproteobacteria bacterium]
MKLPKPSVMRVTRTNTTSKAQRTYTRICAIALTGCAQLWGVFSISRRFCPLWIRRICKANQKQKDAARNFADEMLKNIEVRGVSLSGQDDNVGCVITGLFTVSNNQKTAINSPRLKFNTETFGFEEELEEIVADIENEVLRIFVQRQKGAIGIVRG